MSKTVRCKALLLLTAVFQHPPASSSPAAQAHVQLPGSAFPLHLAVKRAALRSSLPAMCSLLAASPGSALYDPAGLQV